MYKISEFSKIIGVSTADVNRWDRFGLLVSDKSSHFRLWSDDHVEKYYDLKANYPNMLSRRKNTKFKDLTGMTFGKLTVVNRCDDLIGSNGHRHICWTCKCACGNVVNVKGASLLAGYNLSCKCSQYGDPDKSAPKDIKPEEMLFTIKKKPTGRVGVGRRDGFYSGVLDDVTGMRFGLWTVIKQAPTKVFRGGGRATQWLCVCDCGTERVISTCHLKSGASKSCGCIRGTPWLERNVRNILSKYNIPFICQFKPADLHGVGGKQLSYDFAILDNVGNVTYVVECQGIQHFEPVVFFGGSDRFDIQIKHDVLKRQYANDILKTPMIEIDYNHKTKDAVFKKLNEFLNIVG